MPDVLTSTQLSGWRQQFEDKGFVTLSSILDQACMAQITAQVNAVFDPWFKSKQEEIHQYGMVNMHSLTHPKYFAENSSARISFFNAISPLLLVEAVDGIFGEEIHFHNTQLFFNPLNITRIPYWHRDMQYNPIDDSILAAQQHKMTSLHVRIPLIDEFGVELIPGSHKRWDSELERKVRHEIEGHKNSEELPDSELIELKVGDVLIFDANMMHRGHYALNDERKALDLCVGKFHPLTSPFLDTQVLPSNDQLSSILNPRWFQNAIDLKSKIESSTNFS